MLSSHMINWLRAKKSRFCEHVNELSGFIKRGEFLDKLRNYMLIKNNSAAWSYCVIICVS